MRKTQSLKLNKMPRLHLENIIVLIYWLSLWKFLLGMLLIFLYFDLIFWLQIGKGSRGDVTILPTLVINSRQYRGLWQIYKWLAIYLHDLSCDLSLLLVSGKLDKGAVLKAICAGFQETTEPAICLSEGHYLLGFDLSIEFYFCSVFRNSKSWHLIPIPLSYFAVG